MTHRIMHLVVGALCTVTVLVAVGASTPAAAAEGCDKTGYVGGTYGCVVDGTNPPPVTPGGGDGSSTTAPTCNLDAIDPSSYDNSSAPYCAENKVCITVDLFAPVALPAGDKPNEDSTARVRVCRGPLGTDEVGTAFWSDDEDTPSPLEQARTAIGRIELGAPTISTSPTTRSLVNLDTWFWLNGAQQQATGSSAFGLVAIATFQSLRVDPGDGSGPFTCTTLPTSAAEAEKACTHEYRRASTRGTESVDGRPAFAVTATAVYSLRFEINGTPTEVPGAPATLTGPTSTAALRVDEAQTVVRPNR